MIETIPQSIRDDRTLSRYLKLYLKHKALCDAGEYGKSNTNRVARQIQTLRSEIVGAGLQTLIKLEPLLEHSSFVFREAAASAFLQCGCLDDLSIIDRSVMVMVDGTQNPLGDPTRLSSAMTLVLLGKGDIRLSNKRTNSEVIAQLSENARSAILEELAFFSTGRTGS